MARVPRRTRLPLHRRNVLARDKGLCGYCGKPGAQTIDHVVPRSRGGKHRWENVISCHAAENHKKSDYLLSEIGWRLLWKPETPLASTWLVMGLKERNPLWEPYLPALTPA